MRSMSPSWLVLAAVLLAAPAVAQPLAPGEIVVTNEVPSDSSENALLRVNPITGGAQPLVRFELLRDPQRLASAPDGGVYAAESSMRVFHVAADGSAQTLVTRNLQTINDIALAPNGDLLVLENYDQLLRLNPATGTTTLVSSLSDLSSPYRVAVRSNLEVFVYDQGSSRTYRVAGEVQTPIPTARTFCFDAIAYDAASGSLFGLECGGMVIWRIDPDTGQYQELTRDLWLQTDCCGSPPSMELSAGDLLVSTYRSVVRVDPVTGVQEMDLPTLQGSGFGDLAPGSGSAYFVRYGPYVLRFEPAAGVGTGGLLRAVSVPPPFSSSDAPRSVAITPDGKVLVAVGQATAKIDPATRAISVGPTGVADSSYPGALDVDVGGNGLSAHFDEILQIEQGIGAVEQFAAGNNLSSIRSILREASGRVLALEGDEIVRAFPDGSQSIVTRNQLLNAADPRDLAAVGTNLFVTDAASTNLIKVDASNANPDTNQSSVAGGTDLGSARGITAEDAGTLLVAVNNGSCRGIVRVTPSVPSTICFAQGARFEAPFGVAVQAPEPNAAALAVVAFGGLAWCAHRRRSRAPHG